MNHLDFDRHMIRHRNDELLKEVRELRLEKSLRANRAPATHARGPALDELLLCPQTRSNRGLPAAHRARERGVLDLIARGLNDLQIAQRLYLSQKTVRNHVSNIFFKLQVADRAQAIVRAREAGLGTYKV
jgi:DNA-binding NarL/FixJ family response regulator